MDIVSILLGAAASFLAVLLGLFTLGGRITRWLKGITRDVLVETGVIRYLRPGENDSVVWANGWENLPDALEGIAERIDTHSHD